MKVDTGLIASVGLNAIQASKALQGFAEQYIKAHPSILNQSSPQGGKYWINGTPVAIEASLCKKDVLNITYSMEYRFFGVKSRPRKITIKSRK